MRHRFQCPDRTNDDLTPMSNNKYYSLLLGTFVLALAVRVGLTAAFVGLNAPPDAGAQPDQVEYEALAYKPIAGLGYSWDGGSNGSAHAWHVNGLNACLWNVRSQLRHRPIVVLRSVSTDLRGRHVAWNAGARSQCGSDERTAAGGLSEPCLLRDALVSEVPYALFITLATGATLVCMRPGSRVRASVVAGLLWGATALVRPNVLVAVGLIGLLAMVAKESRWDRVRKAITIGVFCALPLAPWVIRNNTAIGAPMLSSVGSYTFWGAHNELTLKTAPGSWIRTEDLIDQEHPFSGTELELDSLAMQYGREFLGKHAADMPYLTAMKFYHLVSPLHETPNRLLRLVFAIAWCVAGPLFLMGAVMEWKRNWHRCQLLGLAVWVTLGTTFVFYGSIRFRDAIAPVYLTFASVAATTAINWSIRHRRTVGPAPVA